MNKMTVEDAIETLRRNEFFYVMPSNIIINNVSEQLLPYFYEKYCKRLEIDQTNYLYDKIIVSDIDCPNEKSEMICFKGFSIKHLVWMGMNKIYEELVDVEEREGIA